jgi:hypothetical protein
MYMTIHSNLCLHFNIICELDIKKPLKFQYSPFNFTISDSGTLRLREKRGGGSWENYSEMGRVRKTLDV